MGVIINFTVCSLVVVIVSSQELRPRYRSRPKGCNYPSVSIGHSKNCFQFIEIRMNWDEAREACRDIHGGDLVILNTETKRRDVLKYMDNQDLREGIPWGWHLGASDRSGSWRWVNGLGVTDGWRQHKGAPQPDDDQGDDTCMYLYTGTYPEGYYDLLSDYKCTSRRYFICERPMDTDWF